MADLEPFRATLWEPDTEARRQDCLAWQERDRRNAIWATAGTGGAALLLAPLAAAAGFPFPFVILALALACLATVALFLILR